MRRADGWIMLSALVLLLALAALFRYAGRTEEFFPLKRIETAAGDSCRIDINSADVPLLSTLPGIGDALAKRIVEYREEHGAFASIDALTGVPGIGEGRLAAIRMFVDVK